MTNRHYGLRRLAALAVGASLSAVLWLAAAPAAAGAGAHGPNGEHLDGEGHAHGMVSQAPRMQAASETFELVATVTGDELSILIDRYATNEPVLGARVELESGPLKAAATFHAEHGDYAVDDPALLKALATPGAHALVITVATATEQDLLDGVLTVANAAADGDHADEHGHAHALRWPWLVAALSLLGLGGAAWWMRRHRRIQGGAA